MTPQEDHALGDLLSQSQNGDSVAYREFLERARKVLTSYFRSKVRSTEALEEILQDSLIAIHQARHTYEAGRVVGPWIYTIAKHRMIDFYRKEAHRESFFQEGDENFWEAQSNTQNATTWTSSQSGTEDPALESALDLLERLPVKQRRVIEELKLNQKSVREVAQSMGLSESDVKVSAMRGLRAVRKKLEKLVGGGSR